MAKAMQMSIKMEPELHAEFMAVAASTHTPAAQIVRQLIRGFIARHETPNPTTIKAMQEADRREGKRFDDAEALFKDLGI
ncbi:MAG: addiction module antitoxin [Deltaproteobacteria bacterium]|nr:addiction module antitoxin [Deltaproteobacteria bacterium]